MFDYVYICTRHEESKDDKQRNQQLITAYNNLYNGMAMVRHVMFMFWSIRIIRIIRLTWPTSQTADLPSVLSLIGKFGLLGYFSMDHLMFAQRLQLWKPSPRTATTVIGIALYGWLTELVATTSEVLVRLSATKSLPDGVAKHTAQLTLIRLLVRYLLDLPIAFHFLQWLPNVPAGVFGMCGIGSTLLSMYDTWPTPALIAAPTVAAKTA